MASNNSVRVRIEAETSNLRQGVDQAANTLKNFQQNATRAQGAARTFTDAIGAIGVASTGAGKAAGLLLGGFALGGPMGGAIAGVQALVGFIRESAAAAEEAAKKADEYLKKLKELKAEAVGAYRTAADKLAVAQADSPTAKHDLETGFGKRDREKAIKDAQKEADALSQWSQTKQKAEASARVLALKNELKAYEKLRAEEREEAEKKEREAGEKVSKDKRDAQLRANKAADDAVRTRIEAELELERQAAEERGEILAWQIEQETKARNKQKEKERKDKEKAEEKRKEDLEAQLENYQQWGGRVGNVMAGVFTQAQTPAEAFKSILGDVASMMIQTAITNITANAATAASGAAASQAAIPIVGPGLAAAAMAAMLPMVLGMIDMLPARALGGNVMAGMPYLVGERGPEVMVPQSGGNIIPNHKLPGGGGGTQINITAMDGASVYRVLTKNAREVARAQRRAARNRS